MRGSPARDISSQRALGPGVRQIWKLVRVPACTREREALGGVSGDNVFFHKSGLETNMGLFGT